MSKPIEEIRVRLNKALIMSGISATELSKKTQIPKSSISQYLSGYSQPTADRLQKLAIALDVDATWLLGYDVPIKSNDKSNDELEDYLEELRTRPELKMLFSLTKDATKEDVEKFVKMIELMLGKGSNER